MSHLDLVKNSDWECILQFLPDNWQEMIKELGMMKFGRKFAGGQGAESLLRTLLIHIAGNKSLRTVSAIAAEGGIAKVSDVAILERLKKAEAWFNWATHSLLKEFRKQISLEGLAGYNIKLIDASQIEEPGDTGSKWRLHLSFNYPDLSPDQIIVDSYRKGETLRNFSVSKDDLLIADRAYGRCKSICYASSHGASVLVRISPSQLPMHTDSGAPFQLKRHLKTIKIGAPKEFEVWIKNDDEYLKGRLCIAKKSTEATAAAEKKVRRKSQKSGNEIREETVEYAGYVMLFTTLPTSSISTKSVFELYRRRWQIELMFKRMKSLLSLAPLYKKSEAGMRSWLSGKLFVAVLIECMIHHADFFSPWGYPIR